MVEELADVQVHLDDVAATAGYARRGCRVGPAPLKVLATLLDAYSGCRRLALDSDLALGPIWTPHATFETTAFLLLGIRHYCTLHPRVATSVFVDDSSSRASGDSEVEAGHAAVSAAEDIRILFTDRFGHTCTDTQAHSIRRPVSAFSDERPESDLKFVERAR